MQLLQSDEQTGEHQEWSGVMTTTPKTVLIAEDDPDIRSIMSFTLSAAGYDVATAANGSEGLGQVRQRPPDVVLLDLMMPVVDGWQFIREWRADPTISGIPVIVVPANYQAARRAELGSLVFLARPVEPSMLLLMLEDALSMPEGNQVAST